MRDSKLRFFTYFLNILESKKVGFYKISVCVCVCYQLLNLEEYQVENRHTGCWIVDPLFLFILEVIVKK